MLLARTCLRGIRTPVDEGRSAECGARPARPRRGVSLGGGRCAAHRLPLGCGGATHSVAVESVALASARSEVPLSSRRMGAQPQGEGTVCWSMSLGCRAGSLSWASRVGVGLEFSPVRHRDSPPDSARGEPGCVGVVFARVGVSRGGVCGWPSRPRSPCAAQGQLAHMVRWAQAMVCSGVVCLRGRVSSSVLAWLACAWRGSG